MQLTTAQIEVCHYKPFHHIGIIDDIDSNKTIGDLITKIKNLEKYHYHFGNLPTDFIFKDEILPNGGSFDNLPIHRLNIKEPTRIYVQKHQGMLFDFIYFQND